MRIAFGATSLTLLGAMIIIAGSPHLRAAQQALLGAGIALTMVNMVIFMLCADAWHEMCTYYEHVVPYLEGDEGPSVT